MNKIINGRKYDTTTATKVYSGTWDNVRAFRWDEIYLKKTGEFFLCERSRLQGEHDVIKPLCLDKAKELVAKYCSAYDYEKLFGEVEE